MVRNAWAKTFPEELPFGGSWQSRHGSSKIRWKDSAVHVNFNTASSSWKHHGCGTFQGTVPKPMLSLTKFCDKHLDHHYTDKSFVFPWETTLNQNSHASIGGPQDSPEYPRILEPAASNCARLHWPREHWQYPGFGLNLGVDRDDPSSKQLKNGKGQGDDCTLKVPEAKATLHQHRHCS